MRILAKIKIDLALWLLIMASLAICYLNYTPQTFLSGWDTLHPEFNFTQYLSRIASVWQEHQGLGAPPSQAHASEIPRTIISLLLTIFFPFEFMRYGYIFLMVVAGPVGVYMFLQYLFKNDRVNPHISQISAFLGGLFYLLNLGTVQHFIVVFEMFAAKFGFLGFIYLFATKYIDNGKKNTLFAFLLIILCSASMAHTATLWYIFYGGLTLYTLIYAYLHTDTRKIFLKRAALLLTVCILINLYWILPNMYYSLNYGNDVITSKIHRLFTEEAYLNNRSYGKISDILIFRNFLFNWRVLESADIMKNGSLLTTSFELMESWKKHLQNPGILLLGYIFSFLSILGAYISVKKRSTVVISIVPITGISIFFLLSHVPVLSQIFDFLRSSNNMMKEILRFPFTKLSLHLIFSFSIFFAFFHRYLLEKISTRIKKRDTILSILFTFFFTALLIIYSLPSFQGNFISKIVRVTIPREYFDLFQWSQKQKQGRVLELPLHTLYGWKVHGWGTPPEAEIYQGAGFTWFGMKQPILDREFDRWYPYNEQCYREFAYALYSQNSELFEKLLTKYNIRYILLDQTIINPGSSIDQRKLFYLQITELLQSINTIRPTRNFGPAMHIYEHDSPLLNDSLYILEAPNNVLPAYKWNYIDKAYEDMGDYISQQKNSNDTNTFQYPMRNILDDKERVDKSILQNLGPYLDKKNELKIEKVDLLLKSTNADKKDCGLQPSKIIDKRLINDSAEYQAVDGTLCDTFSFPQLSQDVGYMLAIESRNTKGLPIRICFENDETKMCVLEDELSKFNQMNADYFIIPPYFHQGGYHLILRNMSIGDLPSINTIKSIRIIPFSYLSSQSSAGETDPATVSHITRLPVNFVQYSPSLYKADFKETPKMQMNQVLTLNQAYEKNWRAYTVSKTISGPPFSYLAPLFGTELTNHVLVNNWANGWLLNNITIKQFNNFDSIIIIFLPQYLEFLGFAILILTFLYIFRTSNRPNSNLRG